MSDPITPLGARIPEEGIPDDGEALDVFLGWVAERGLELYPAQEEAILELFDGKHVVLETPTGSGKSLVAIALHFRELCAARKSVYTAPIKALVSEKFFALCQTFGAENVGLMTGDGAVNRDAPVLCCTAEVLANMSLRMGAATPYEAVVMDEFHYYGDRDRGVAWQLPLLTMPDAQHLLMSATLGDMTNITDDLIARSRRELAHVRSPKRPVPLVFEYSLSPLQDTVLGLLRSNKSPLYVIHFSQSAAGETAGALMSVRLTEKEDKQVIKDALRGFRFDSPYGQDLRRYLMHGVGLHHAGLLPKYRLLVEKLAQQGLLSVICGTDTLGVGINVPIRAALFTQLCKFDGEKVDLLTVRDFKQIAGRAGRKGFDDEGLVVAQAPEWVIENKKRADAAASGKGHKKRYKTKSAPTFGYKHWDEQIYRNLIANAPEEMPSRFQVDHGMLLSLLQRAEEVGGDGLEMMHALIELSHATNKDKLEMHERAEALLEELVVAGVATRSDDGVHGISEALQQDFSLHHALSLFLLHAVAQLDVEAPDYAFNVLTLVESILEHPRVLLRAQVNVLKGRLITELKAQGMEYDDRMAALEEVTWPKPMEHWIYDTFNTYRAEHPWVSAEHIRPKSIARDMAEQYASFNEYIRELNITRAEGVLLRYLSQAYKGLLENVPAEAHTPELLDLIAFLRATVARVDSSLITEWEALLAGEQPEADGAPPPPLDISRDKRRFAARVRAELHGALKAMSIGDYEEARICLRHRGEGDEADPSAELSGHPEWSAEDIEAALAPYLEEYGRVRFDGEARMAWNTRLTPAGHHLWEVQQILVDDEGDNAWSIDGVIDLRGDTNPDGPLVELVKIGI